MFFNCCTSKDLDDVNIPLQSREILFSQWNDIFINGEIIKFTYDRLDQEIISVGDMIISSVGDYFILDGKAKKIWCFDGNANLKQIIGSYGEGPGEYTHFGCPFLDKNNNFYIYDIGKRRINKYKFPDYKFESQFRVPISIQDLIIDDEGNFIVYTVSEPFVMFKINNSGEIIEKSLKVNEKNFRIFSSRFQLGRFCQTNDNLFIVTYPEEYKIYLYDYQFNLKKLFYSQSDSRYFPAKSKFPGTLSPNAFTPKHSKWWSQSLRPTMVLYLGNRIFAKQIIEFTNLSAKFYVNIHDMDGFTYAAGIEVLFDGIIRYAKDGYIYVVEDSKFDNDNNVIPLKIHRFKVKDNLK